MYKFRIVHCIGLVCLAIASCKIPVVVQRTENNAVPGSFAGSSDTTNTADIRWRNYFNDPNLVNLIDTALKNNQELMITLQEVEIARNDIRFRQGPLLPSVSAKAGIGVEKVGRYTSQWQGDASTEIKPGKEMPDP